jgi:hypothetical protein
MERTQAEAGNMVTRSWKQALMGGIGCIGFGALAIYLFSNEHEFWAVVTAIAAFGGAVMAVRGRQGKCPKCGTVIHFEDSSSPSPCTMCGRYSRIERGEVKFVERGFVAASPSFKVPFDAFLIEPNKLAHRWPWRWPRPGQCCVCGAPMTRGKEYVVTLKAGISAQGLRLREGHITIPHCNSCSEGVVPKHGTELEFRSYDYWREFCDLNDLPLIRE